MHPIGGNHRNGMDVGATFPGSGVVLPEEAATAAILAGESRREVLVAAPADASLAVLTAWVIALAVEAQPQSGQRLTPLRMYLSRQRPDTVRLVTYVF